MFSHEVQDERLTSDLKTLHLRLVSPFRRLQGHRTEYVKHTRENSNSDYRTTSLTLYVGIPKLFQFTKCQNIERENFLESQKFAYTEITLLPLNVGNPNDDVITLKYHWKPLIGILTRFVHLFK